MRLFWIVILIFAGVAGAVAWTELRGPGSAAESSGQAVIDRSADPTTPSRRPDREPDPGSVREAASADDSGGSRRSGPPSPWGGEDRVEVSAMSLAEELLASAENPDRSGENDGAGDVEWGDFFGVGAPTPGGGSGAPPGAPAGHEHVDSLRESENPWKDGQKSTIEHSVVTRDDGSILLDGLFEITGSGTPDDPYEVSWELLMSAAESYQPRLGMTDIPERIRKLDDAHVRITGYLLFPMIGADAREMLMMLNMWDGCCLGTMPSPYDAIEVQLTNPPSSDVRRFSNYGAIEGVMRIDPYLINDYLIGLYLMEDATLRVGM